MIHIGLVDDHAMFREGLASLLEEYDDIRVSFSARNSMEMQQLIARNTIPQVILMDVNLPKMDGHASTHWLKLNYPDIHVIALSMYEDEINIVKMLKSGAGGYILKEESIDEVVRAIRSILLHGIYLNGLVSGRLVHMIRSKSEDAEIKLTEREKLFLQHCCSELTYKEIAHEMKISPRTIENYCEDLFKKLGVRSRTGMAMYALKTGIVNLRP